MTNLDPRILDLLPKKQYCSYHPDNGHWNFPKGHTNKDLLYCSFCDTFHVYNNTIDFCISALSAAEIGVCPSRTSMSNIVCDHIYFHNGQWILHDKGADKIALKIRELMLGKKG